MQYVIEHPLEVIAALTSLVTVASFIANLTPTDADNKAVAAVAKFINLLALNFKK